MALTVISACSKCGKRIQTRKIQKSAPICHPCRRREPQRKSYGEPRKCARPECEAIFTPGARAKGKPQQQYCSRPCAAGGVLGQSRFKVCEVCGAEYHATYCDQRTCSRACGVELRRRENGTAGRQRTHWPSSRIYVQACGYCGELFTGRTKVSRYCSRRCQDTAYNDHRRGGPPQWRCACGAEIPAGRHKCDGCLAAVKRARRQYERRAERARKRGVKRERYTMAEIAARDRYRCGICIAEGRARQARVAMTKAVPHQRAPTIDHVVPLSEGGEDIRANVQLAHFICNSRKWIRGSQQLALIG